MKKPNELLAEYLEGINQAELLARRYKNEIDLKEILRYRRMYTTAINYIRLISSENLRYHGVRELLKIQNTKTLIKYKDGKHKNTLQKGI